MFHCTRIAFGCSLQNVNSLLLHERPTPGHAVATITLTSAGRATRSSSRLQRTQETTSAAPRRLSKVLRCAVIPQCPAASVARREVSIGARWRRASAAERACCFRERGTGRHCMRARAARHAGNCDRIPTADAAHGRRSYARLVSDSAMADLVTFCVSRRRLKMYCGHARLSVCLGVCPRPYTHTTARTRM